MWPPDLQDGGTSLCLISGNITISNDDEMFPIIYLVPTSGEFHHPGSEALGDLEPETRTRIIRDSAAITHDPALTDGKGSTLMEEDIEGLGHGKRFDTMEKNIGVLGGEDIFMRTIVRPAL